MGNRITNSQRKVPENHDTIRLVKIDPMKRVAGSLLGVLHYTAGLSFTVNELKCVYENDKYAGDNISDNVVVVDL